MFSRKIQSLCIALFWLCAAVPQMAFAEYPEHPVTVYHPFEPTPYDALSKVYNAEMSKILGVPFVFEYGMMGKAAKATLNGKPDGYTVYFAAMGPMVLKPNMVGPSASPKDFRAVGRATLLPILFVANKNAPFKTFEEFKAYAKAHPGKARIGITNAPSSLQIGMTHLIKDLAKLDVQLVEQPDGPVRGTIDCLIGDTDALISHPPDIMRYIRRGDFVPLATFAPERLAMLPDVPTLRELGYDFSQTSWRVLVVNKDTPDAIVEKLAKASERALNSPAMKKSAEENYEILAWLPPSEADAFLQSEFDFYRDLSMSMGLHLGPFGFVRRLTTANGIHKKQGHMLAGACACLPVSERAASILSRRLCRSPQRTGGPMTGCGTERYADWFFDLDGTLVDSAPDILRLLGGVLREEGLAVPELDKGRIGPLLEDIIRGLCPDLSPADLERIVRIYRARYRACPFDESPAFPGIPPLFERL